MPGITIHWEIPSEEPIQSVEWVPQKYVPPQTLRRAARPETQFSAIRIQEPELGTPPVPESDPRARCN
jgi:hypothetical protein